MKSFYRLPSSKKFVGEVKTRAKKKKPASCMSFCFQSQLRHIRRFFGRLHVRDRRSECFW